MASTTQTLTNSSQDPSYMLQSHPDPPHRNALRLAPSDEQSLIWTITLAPENPGKWHISTTTPDGQPKRLDLYNDNSGNKTRVCLADPGFYSGQFWTLVPCDEKGREMEPKWFKLSNDWTGPGWFLDVDSQTGAACMRDGKGENRGQRWFVDVPTGMVEEHAGVCRDVETRADRGERLRRFEMVRLASAVVIGFVMGRLSGRFVW